MHLYTLRADQITELLFMMSVVNGDGAFHAWSISADQQTLNVYLVDNPLTSQISTTPVDLDPVIPDTPLPAPPPLTLVTIEPSEATLADLDLTLICRGISFRDTTVIVINDVAQPTVYVSPEELNMIFSPQLYPAAAALEVQVQQDQLIVPAVGLPFTLTGVTATGVVAGTPGDFLPPGASAPATLIALQAAGALGQTTAWGAGQYVVLADFSEASWNGTAWASGRRPAMATGATAGTPGTWTPGGASVPGSITVLQGASPPVIASPTTAWTVGQHVIMGNLAHAYWNATAWVAGNAP